ncbi:patatin-like phospholipase family protein [Rhodococcus wratislaviensis]|uniref:PNPLA domain-containing protein n=1 Tax=Rhodococcus wratislaviensis NBRC 100605 TaxID=1219028 RepID=X0PRI0_RHOWR|nr:patatin-like phospholipase family protein [Rhodococcus wratislaviensis]GAF45504.1 hypothetical protein RW1_022_00840 [Rhodococcus wratislaviensis NBRC 100605]
MSHSEIRRAVVLGGGGVTGIAWEIGVLAGLSESGISLADHADALYGTSAGAFAATLIASGADIAQRYRDQFEQADFEIAVAMPDDVAQRYNEAVQANYGNAIPLAKAYGHIARTSDPVSPDVRLRVVRHRLGVDRWPNDRLRLTAIDADTGKLVVLDSSSGLSLVEAANASGAVPGIWPMVSAGGRNWIDGGMISAANAELGTGFDRVLVIAPVPESTAGFDSVDAAAAKLRETAEVTVITPNRAAVEAIGPNVFDPSRRGACAHAGLIQAREASAEILARWVA